ncbi:interleukin-8 [Chanos chanos]|uniref:Interleukin-8 n=1 Tax=Chanos chanos TaxID=29144 RepID=A0A6J2UP44_CHACN|nr:C-X-C motif chemokine 13 [Chanos chanos]
MDGFAFGHKCRCVRTTSSFIHPRQYKKIEILPVGANCRRTEILILKKNNNTVCVNPDAKWVKKVINRFVNRSENTQGTARTVTLSGWP